MQCPNPRCQAILKSFTIEKATASVGPQTTQYKMAAYCCPYCGIVLGTEMDPVSFKAEIIAKVIEGLGARTTTARVRKTTRIIPKLR